MSTPRPENPRRPRNPFSRQMNPGDHNIWANGFNAGKTRERALADERVAAARSADAKLIAAAKAVARMRLPKVYDESPAMNELREELRALRSSDPQEPTDG